MPASGRRFDGLLAVERGGDRQRVGIDLAHRVERRAGAVVGLDAREIGRGSARVEVVLPSASACCNSASEALSTLYVGFRH